MTEIQDAAQTAIDAGWELVRIVKGEKEPSGQWRNANPKAADFQDGDQLAFKAGEPSGNRVCLDGACPEVIELLPRFVNMQNAWVEGRPSKPKSHWWVAAENTPKRRFKDVDGSTILEVISTGGHAVVPPSVNTAGSTPEIRRSVEPRPALLQPVNPERFKLLAVCALLARHWPGQGSRHELVGPLTGLLLRCGVHLHDELRPVVQFAYITGWRKNEVLTLEWRQVDFQANVVRLEPGTAKNGKGREFPFTRELRPLLETQRAEHERLTKQGFVIRWVFYRMVAKGRRGKKSPRAIKSYLKAFKTACKHAGCPGRLPHDFRRSAVRNLVRAGVPQSVAMKMTGHQTDSVFRRYDIVSPDDLRIAAERLDAVTA